MLGFIVTFKGLYFHTSAFSLSLTNSLCALGCTLQNVFSYRIATMHLFFNYRNSKEQHIKNTTFFWLQICLLRSEIFLIFMTVARI